MRAVWSTMVAMRAAWAVMRQHRWRSVITLLVCSLGTAGAVVSGVLGQVNVAEMQARLRSLGGGLVVVSPNKLPPFPGRARQLEHFISLVPEDAETIRATVPGVEDAVPVVARNTTIRYGPRSARVRLIGTSARFAEVREFRLARGRFLADYDDVDRVIVLGHAVARELSAPGVGVGETVLLGMNPFTVVGVLEPQGVNFAGEDEDHQVFIPLAGYVRRIANRPWLNHVYLRLRSDANSESFVRRVGTVLRDRHERRRDQVDDAIVRNLADVAAEQTSLLATTTWAVTATSGLLLIMGVVGIATLMLLVVRQRRSEVGLRRALGATPADIAVQFFVEGAALATVGVFAGILAGAGVSWLVSGLATTPVEVDAKLPLIGAAGSLIASAVACAVPAITAALLEPANALRS